MGRFKSNVMRERERSGRGAQHGEGVERGHWNDGRGEEGGGELTKRDASDGDGTKVHNNVRTHRIVSRWEMVGIETREGHNVGGKGPEEELL